jgi:hypothetical protein
VASELETPQHQQGHQAAYMEAVCGGVEAAIQGARTTCEVRSQLFFAGELKYELASPQIL